MTERWKDQQSCKREREMEAKKVLLSNMVMLVLLLPLLAVSASTGEPSVDVPARDTNTGQNGKQQLKEPNLECCDDCRCSWRRSYWDCRCRDWTQGGYCTNGCYNCKCDNMNYPYFCRCNDWLDSCPRKCMEYRNKDGARETQNKA